MPSDLNVIAVRVPPERLKAVKRISGACGMSMSAWINAMLDEAIPMSERAMRAAVMAEAGQEEFIQQVAIKTEGFTKISKSACEQLVLKVGEMVENYNIEEE